MDSTQQYAYRSQEQQQENVFEGLRELTLNTPVDKLRVLCESMVDLKNLKANGFDIFGTLRS